MIQAPGTISCVAAESPVNPKPCPCGTFSWPTSKSPLSPFSMAAKSLLLPKPRGKKKHSKTSWSSSFPSEPRGPFPHFRTSWFSSFTSEPHGPLSIYLLQNLVGLLFPSEPHGLLSFTSEPCGLLLPPPKPCGPPLLWLQGLSLNPSAHLPLQPHFQLLLQSATPASIPVFFQLYWAAIVSLGRCGPMAWSQSSPSFHAGPVTRGSCFPVPSWVEVTPIPLAQSRATAT